MAKKGKSRWLRWVVVIVVLAVIAGTVWHFKSKTDDTVQYQATPVTRGDITQAVTATGTLNPVVNVQVGSQISGRIAKMYVDYNSSVTQGQVIAEIDPLTYQAAVQRAEADLSSAMASLELAQVEARRAEQLYTNSLISSSEHDSTIASLHQAEAAAQIRRAALDSAKVDLSRCTIYSPVDGTVISRSVDIGQTVAASLQAPVLFQIANDLTKMQIDANVSEADIGAVEDGQSVTFSVDAFPDRKFDGKVVQIRNSPTTVQNVVTYDAVIAVSNPDLKLRPGMTANASIITAERDNVLRIPNAALRFKPVEPTTNQTFIARMFAKLKPAEKEKSAATNDIVSAKSGDTNKVEVAAAGEPPLTGNEPPDELFRRLREMRERGEQPSPEVRAKLREMFQSGAFPRPGGGGNGPGGFRGASGGGGSRSSAPSWRTVYISTNTPAVTLIPEAARVKTGISDGSFTEVTEGLKEGDMIVTGIKFSQTTAAAPSGNSPFGGGGGFRRGR